MVLCESGSNLARARTLFLRLVAVCFAMAFVSLYPQIPGLYGPNGILPVYMVLKENAGLNFDKLVKQVCNYKVLQPTFQTRTIVI